MNHSFWVYMTAGIVSMRTHGAVLRPVARQLAFSDADVMMMMMNYTF